MEGYLSGQQYLAFLQRRMEDPATKVINTAALIMTRFVDLHDAHVLDRLLREWDDCRQRTSETILAFRLRFSELADELHEQGHAMSDEARFRVFRTRILDAQRISERRSRTSSPLTPLSRTCRRANPSSDPAASTTFPPQQESLR
jgi:hypothetical protein